MKLRCTFLVLLVSLLQTDVAVASADTPSQDTNVWETMTVPATAASTAKLAGLAGPVERARLLLELIPKLHETKETSESSPLRLTAYLEAVDRIQSAWKDLDPGGSGLDLRVATSGTERVRLERFLASAGLSLVADTERFQIVAPGRVDAVERRRVLSDGGFHLDDFVRELNKGRTARPTMPACEVPLPLPFNVWSRVVFDGRVTPASLFKAIISDRQTSLLYYGLTSLDPETLRLLAANPTLLARIHRDHAGAFAVFGRSLSMKNGRIVLPGGSEATDLWQKLLGARADEPAGFITAVLRHDGGRFAYFYDTLAHLDERRIKFALSAWITSRSRQFERFAALYGAFQRITAEPNSFSSDRPFGRAAMDPTILLFQVGAAESGEPLPPASAALWLAVFETEDVSESVGQFEATAAEPFHAAWLIERIFAPVQQHRYDRFDALMFAQRVFSSLDHRVTPDAVVALRGFGRYRALMLSLERMGIRDPSLYAIAVRRAARVGAIRNEDRGTVAHSLFQGMLAIVERARFTTRVTTEDAAALVRSAVALEPDASGRYLGGVSTWIEKSLLPAVATKEERARASQRPEEDVLLDVLAGVVRPVAAGVDVGATPVVRWLDWSYRLDIGGELRARMIRIRARQGGNSLDGVLALARVALELSSGLTEIAAVRGSAVQLAQLAKALDEPPWPRARDEREWSVAPTVQWALAELASIRRPEDLPRSKPVGNVLAALSDVLLAFTLRSIVYATFLGDPDGPLLLGGDVAQRHDFGLTIKDNDTRLHAAWSLPEEPSGYGLNWQVWGSLLGLDVGLVRLSLQQVTSRRPPELPGFDESVRKGLLQSVALFNPFDRRDHELAVIAGRLARGRARAAQLRSQPADVDILARELRLEERRWRALVWALTYEPDALDRWFTLLELFHLGEAGQRSHDFDDWGASFLSWNGCLCLRMPSPQAWEDLAGRPDSGYLASRFPDLGLRVAEVLSEFQLPAALAQPVLVFAVQDLFDESAANRPDDQLAAARYALDYPQSRIEAFVSSLTATGILVPVSPRR